MSDKLVLIINCGSSSLKFAILDPIKKIRFLSGSVEYFYLSKIYIKWIEIDGEKKEISLDKKSTYSETIQFIVDSIIVPKSKLFKKIVAIGHRIVHGGEKYTESVIINEDVINCIKNATQFAPLHNPANLIGIKETLRLFPELKNKNVAVFDTAFHQTMPEESYLYALPYNLYKKYGIRRYGFHGISNYYVMQESIKILKKPAEKLNIIICHLGNGSSVSAIRNGKCVDTSMGLTPLEGLVMGTRSGDIDPSIIFFLHKNLGMNMDQIFKILNKESGLLGLTEVSSDCRYIEDNYNNKINAKRAIDVYCHRLAKYIGSYVTLVDGCLDAVIFTGGIGENAPMIREFSLKKLSILGFDIDHKRNLNIRFGKSGFISKEGTRPALVIPTNEELIIAQDTARLTY